MTTRDMSERLYDHITNTRKNGGRRNVQALNGISRDQTIEMLETRYCYEEYALSVRPAAYLGVCRAIRYEIENGRSMYDLNNGLWERTA